MAGPGQTKPGGHEGHAADVEKAQTSAMRKYLATAFLLSSDRRQYVELVLSLNNDYAKQQQKNLKPSQKCTG